ncbi:MAG: hypothetical protein HYR94_26955, partial [Chloroflexi bacterium]|nr:hypothetical protein [Chloroflexota bacterium]
MLILAMLGSLLPPAPIALASPTQNGWSAGRSAPYPTPNLQPLSGNDPGLSAGQTAQADAAVITNEEEVVQTNAPTPRTFSLPFNFDPAPASLTARSNPADSQVNEEPPAGAGAVPATHNAGASTLAALSPAFQSGGGWYYPYSYLGTDGKDTVGDGAAIGRPFDYDITTPENLTSGSESSEMEFYGHVEGPNEPGWDLWNDEHCIRYDFGSTLYSSGGFEFEGLLSRVDVSSGGFAAIDGRIHFYDANWNQLGDPIVWASWEDDQVKSGTLIWSSLRYVQVCMMTGLSSDTPWDGWVAAKYVKVRPLSVGYIVPPYATLTTNGCPVCGNNTLKQHFVGGPINSYSGNYNYQATDLSLATVGQPLKFERSYNSLPVSGTVVYSRPLGYGWTHNYDINLSFPYQAGGEPGAIILKAPHGSRLRFTINPDGSYTPDPGVWASMTRQGTTLPYTYVITTANQTVYTFVEALTPFSTSVITKLIASDGLASDNFGRSVVISGDTAVVGADLEDSSYFNQGAVYIYKRDGDSWTQTQKLSSSAPIAREYFGRSLAVSGDYLFVGAPGDPLMSRYVQTYIFKRAFNGTWSLDDTIQAGTTYGFGRRVALEGDIALIGTPDSPIAFIPGGVNVYYYDTNAQQWWGASPFEVDDLPEGAALGDSFDLNGNTAVVTAYNFESSWVYVFERDGMTSPPVWNSAVQLTSSDPDFNSGRKNVAINGDTIIIGNLENANPPYVFVRDGTGWSQQGSLTPTETIEDFASGVDGYRDIAIFGTECTDEGAAYVFGRESANWDQQAILTTGDLCFGANVAMGEIPLVGTTAIFGATDGDGNASGSGAAYLYQVG